MNQYDKKCKERRFVECAAASLGLSWTLEDCEAPDFIVCDGSRTFGLEVCEVSTGKNTKNGAESRKYQSHRQTEISKKRQEYEQSEYSAPLIVEFLGSTKPFLLDDALQDLRARKLALRPYGYGYFTELRNHGHTLKLKVRRLKDGSLRDIGSRPDWHHVEDTVGLVEGKSPRSRRTVEEKLRSVIRDKSEKLSAYREKVARHSNLKDSARAEVELLLVADRMWSYGMVSLQESSAVEHLGFNAIYYLPHPTPAYKLRRSPE